MGDDTKIVPFGKYKGQPIEVLASDRGYADWLMGQAWFRERFGAIHTIIVNNFQEASETPEHNALQALFLDDDFCRRFFVASRPHWADRIYGVDGEPNGSLEVAFERDGVDVQIRFYLRDKEKTGDTYHVCSETAHIEIKPTVSDDYPAVLRQIRSSIRESNRFGSMGIHNYLFLETYTGRGATRDQFEKIFASADIRVVFRSDVQGQP